MLHRQARIRAESSAMLSQDPTPNEPTIHHVIGKSHNFPVDMSAFIQSNKDDPATKVRFDFDLDDEQAK